MGGGLMQLVAYGAQDIYLTGNPQITFFKVVYRRHTNFSCESIQQTFNGSVGFGNRVTATIARNGDLVKGMCLEMSVTDAGSSNIGSALINEVELEIGGQRIDKHYGHWMEVWSELTESNPGNVQGTAAANMVDGTKFQNMSYSGGVVGMGANVVVAKMFVPLQFWFCRNPGLALPLIALQYHEVKVILTFATAAALAGGLSASDLSCDLWCDYVYLDTDERRRFAQVSHEYLIEQVQFMNSASSTSHDLVLNHPVKELIWTGGVTSPSTATTNGPSTPLALTAASTYKLTLNGHDRFAARDRQYFTRCQVYDHHKGGGLGAASGSANDTIAVYSFALEPEEHQPSGTCNFSRIDTAQLKIDSGAADAFYIYAVNYNVLRIMSGMGGLAYSN
jgi:hypothetical protein